MNEIWNLIYHFCISELQYFSSTSIDMFGCDALFLISLNVFNLFSMITSKMDRFGVLVCVDKESPSSSWDVRRSNIRWCSVFRNKIHLFCILRLSKWFFALFMSITLVFSQYRINRTTTRFNQRRGRFICDEKKNSNLTFILLLFVRKRAHVNVHMLH